MPKFQKISNGADNQINYFIRKQQKNGSFLGENVAKKALDEQKKTMDFLKAYKG